MIVRLPNLKEITPRQLRADTVVKQRQRSLLGGTQVWLTGYVFSVINEYLASK